MAFRGDGLSGERERVLRGAEAVDDVLIDETLDVIRSLTGRRTVPFMRSLGAYVLGRFFADSADAFRSGSRDHVSFRKLAAREDMPLSYTTLYHAVAIEIQARALPEDVAAALSLTHHRILLPIKGRERKKALARRALDEALSTRRFQTLVRSERQVDEVGSGRRPVPPVLSGLRQVLKGMDTAMEEHHPMWSVSDKDLNKTRTSIDQFERRLESFQGFLSKVRHYLEPVTPPTS